MKHFLLRFRTRGDAGAPVEERVVRRHSWDHAFDAWMDSLDDDPDWELISIKPLGNAP